MYEESIRLLKQQGVEFSPGLTSEELKEVEKTYDICFPASFKQFLTEGVPISSGFYNWRNFDQGNVNRIKQVINFPVEQINEFADELDWCDEWGAEPHNSLAFEKAVKKKLEAAPKLLPIYAHRYIPVFSDDNPQVLSIHGADVICYGENIEEYFKVEFGSKNPGKINLKNVTPVPFWSDIM